VSYGSEYICTFVRHAPSCLYSDLLYFAECTEAFTAKDAVKACVRDRSIALQYIIAIKCWCCVVKNVCSIRAVVSTLGKFGGYLLAKPLCRVLLPIAQEMNATVQDTHWVFGRLFASVN
jgi:hypothetical protein